MLRLICLVAAFTLAAGCRTGTSTRPATALQPPARHGGCALVADPAAAGVRHPGRPLPRDLLLGLVLHDAGTDRERSDRPRAQHARQLCLPGRGDRARPEREPDVLPEP